MCRETFLAWTYFVYGNNWYIKGYDTVVFKHPPPTTRRKRHHKRRMEEADEALNDEIKELNRLICRNCVETEYTRCKDCKVYKLVNSIATE